MKKFEFIAVDFDGTLNKHAFPEIGPPNRRIIEFIKFHAAQGTKIILHTCREDDEPSGRQYLTEAVEWCKEHEIPIDAINENPFVSFGGRKIYADIYLDDRAVNVNSINQPLKIGGLEQHCGDCWVIELCGDPFDYCLCTDERFTDITEEKYEELSEKIDWQGFKKHPPCIGCNRDCDECEEESEERDMRVRFIADKVAELLKRQLEVKP